MALLVPLTLRVFLVVCCTAVAIGGGVATSQLNSPLSSAATLPFSETYYAKAAAADSDESRLIWAKKALDAAPTRAENWVLLAYTYQISDTYPSDRFIFALRRSYEIAPLSADVHEWRLALSYDNWKQLPTDLRARVTQEAIAYSTRDAGNTYLRRLQSKIEDRDAVFSIGVILQTRRNHNRVKWLEQNRLY